MLTKINLYIIKKFLINFTLVIVSVSLLIAMINIFELLDRIAGKQIGFWQIALLDILQVPSFIEDIAIFLIMISSMITLFSLSIRSEITVMRSSGLSFWQILYPIAAGAFLLGLFFVLIFNPISITASKKLNNMEQKLIEKEEVNLLAPPNGIWLKQENVLNSNEDIIIRADKIYRKNLKMTNVNLWFFDKNHKFYKKIDAKNMFLEEGFWNLQNAVINDSRNINQPKDNIEIATNLKAEFITKKILNNFENVRLFSVYDLPNLINDLKDSGFSPRKFVVYYNSLLTKPFLFIAMALMAAFFAVNNVRSRNNIIIFVLGIAVGLVLYISFIIVNALGSSGLVPTFLATWMMVIILTAISILLIFRKEIIN
ncbi:MAG: LptF/LptG family permease [Pseudomonadota bacterium]